MHLKRWITGLIALPILIFLVYTGGIAFSLLVSAATVLALWEYNRLVLDPALAGVSGLIVGWGYVLGVAIIWAAHWIGTELILSLVAVNLVVVALMSMFHFKADPAVLRVIARQLQGTIYIPVLLSFLILIRTGDSGMSWIFFFNGYCFCRRYQRLLCRVLLGPAQIKPGHQSWENY